MAPDLIKHMEVIIFTMLPNKLMGLAVNFLIKFGNITESYFTLVVQFKN